MEERKGKEKSERRRDEHQEEGRACQWKRRMRMTERDGMWRKKKDGEKMARRSWRREVEEE